MPADLHHLWVLPVVHVKRYRPKSDEEAFALLNPSHRLLAAQDPARFRFIDILIDAENEMHMETFVMLRRHLGHANDEVLNQSFARYLNDKRPRRRARLESEGAGFAGLVVDKLLEVPIDGGDQQAQGLPALIE